MSIAAPLVIRAVVDRAVRPGRAGLLLPLVGLLLLTALIRGVGFSLRRRHSGVASVQTEAALRLRLYEHLQGMDLAYHQSTPAGQLMSRATSDLHAVRDLLVKLPILTGMAVQLALVVGLLVSFDAGLALLALAGTPLTALLAPRLTRRLAPAVWRTQQNLAELTALVEETVTGIRVVKAFGRESFQVERLRTLAERVRQRAVEAVRIRATLYPVFEAAPVLGLAAVIWYGGHRALAGEISLGTLVAASVYVTQLSWPMRMLGGAAADAQRAATAAGRIFDVLDTPPGVADREGAVPLEVTAGEVVFDGVRYDAPDGRTVLRGVDLTVPAGSSVALVGPTGCGKTTLLRLALRFLEPTEGRVLVDGADVAAVTLDSLRARMGTVFEETFLFSDTVAANIAFGRPAAAEEDVVRAAVLARAHDFVQDLPQGYATAVGDQGYTLSGGQRQRIAIARAILMDPRILLLDDATSAVDPEIEAEIRRGLATAMEGRTSIVVARRPGTAALAGAVVYMEGGRVVAAGPHAELWERLPAYREVLSGAAPALAAASTAAPAAEESA